MVEVLNFIIAILLGALIGLQREYEQQHTHIIRFAGLRTFILISLLGSILAYFSQEVINDFSLVIIGFITITLFALASYIITFLKYNDNTATTEIAAVLTFIIGVMTTLGFLDYAIIFAIVIAVFLTFKTKLHSIAEKIKKEELFAIVEFALISLVVLPLLPRTNYSPLDIPVLKEVLLATPISQAILQNLNVFNLYNIWLMVILVAGISFLGYFLVKFLGTKKGYGLTGFVGGLISSTAVTLSMSGESKKYKKIVFPFVVAVMVASATSYLRILLEILIINKELIGVVILPLGTMAVVGYLSAFILLKKKTKTKKVKEIEFKQPFALSPAVKFGLFFGFVIFAARLLQLLFGSSGLYFASILSGLADVDAITLTMSSLSAAGEISSKVAVTAIILAASSNTMVKAGIAYFMGEKKFAKWVVGISILILILGLGSLMFI